MKKKIFLKIEIFSRKKWQRIILSYYRGDSAFRPLLYHITRNTYTAHANHIVKNYLHINNSYSLACHKAKSRKYQGILKVKILEQIRQARLNWSQQLEHNQVPEREAEPGIRKGKRYLLECHTSCKCSMETIREIDGKSDRLGNHYN